MTHDKHPKHTEPSSDSNPSDAVSVILAEAPAPVPTIEPPKAEPKAEPAPPRRPLEGPQGRIVHADCEVVYQGGVYRILQDGWSQKVNGISKWQKQHELEAALVEWRRGR
jgi:hypothetical protein